MTDAKIDPGASLWPALGITVLAIGLLGIVLAALQEAGLRLPPSPLFMLAVVFAAFRFGVAAGIVAVAVMTLNQALFLRPPSGWEDMGDDSLLRIAVTSASGVMIAVLVDRLRRRAEDGARSNQAIAVLRTQMAERRLAHERLAASERDARRMARIYQTLSQGNQAIVRCTSAQALFPTICRVLVADGGFHAAWIGVVRDASTTFEIAAQYGPASHLAAAWAAPSPDGSPGMASTLQLGLAEEMVCNSDADLAPAAWQRSAREAGIAAVAGFVLYRGGQRAGVLCVATAQGTPLDEAAARLLREIAADVSFALATFEREAARLSAEDAVRSLNLALEARVAERTAALLDANRELEAFSYSVSHDLRAPLRAVDGFSRLLEEDHGAVLPGAAKALLQRIRGAALHMNRLIEAILQLSRVSRHELRHDEVDLSAAAAGVIADLQAGDSEHRVAVHIAPGLTAPGDPALLRTALQNLLDNAWKYSRRRSDARIEIRIAPGADGPALCVRDNGVGFDMAHAKHLFEPFRRLHGEAEFEGTGIGLATVARVARRHNGRVWAESAPGRGAVFYLALPGLRGAPSAGGEGPGAGDSST